MKQSALTQVGVGDKKYTRVYHPCGQRGRGFGEFGAQHVVCMPMTHLGAGCDVNVGVSQVPL